MTEPKRIDGRAKTVRELLQGARYTIDFYQCEYAWQEHQVQKLLDDLTRSLRDPFDLAPERPRAKPLLSRLARAAKEAVG